MNTGFHFHSAGPVFPPRYRRGCLGKLIQIDGSPHDYFEGHAPKCCLLIFIDDVTGRLMNLRLVETTSALIKYRRLTARSTAFSGLIMVVPLQPEPHSLAVRSLNLRASSFVPIVHSLKVV